MSVCQLLAVVSLAMSLRRFHVSGCDPPVFSPPRLVVKFGDPASSVCKVCDTCVGEIFELEKPLGQSTKNGSTISWRAERMTEWTPAFICFYGDHEQQCQTKLPVTVYKPPDLVSTSLFNHSGPMTEGLLYTLQCEVQGVAPVENLTVTFYRGQISLGQRQSSSTAKKPVTETFTLDIIPSKEDDGAQYWCDARLELGDEGPLLYPVVTSERVSVPVHYKPQLEVPSHPDPITVTEGNPLKLSCAAVGNPSSSYDWDVLPGIFPPCNTSDITIKSVGFEHEGQYSCTISNKVGTVSVTYNVFVKANNFWPIIIGVISGILLLVISMIILHHYYKQSRKGRYNLKDVFRVQTRHTAVRSED